MLLLYRLSTIGEITRVATTHEASANTVFTIALVCNKLFPESPPLLKDGQYIHKKIVPKEE